MSNLIIEKKFNEYIRTELNKSVSKDLKDTINNKLQELLKDASKRSELEGRKTILPRHI